MGQSTALREATEGLIAARFRRRLGSAALERRVYRPIEELVRRYGEREVVVAIDATAVHLRRRDPRWPLRGDGWLLYVEAVLRNREQKLRIGMCDDRPGVRSTPAQRAADDRPARR